MRVYLIVFAFIMFALPSKAQEFFDTTVVKSKYPSVAGTYKGSLPCEECKIINAELELIFGTDSTGEFALRERYISDKGTDIASRIKGNWKMDIEMLSGKMTTLIIINEDLPEKQQYYLLKADGSLLPLDSEKQPMKAAIDLTMKKE